MRKAVLSILIAAAGMFPVIANAYSVKDEADINNRLMKAQTYEDSIAALWDLFDIVPRQRQFEVGQRIYKMAKRNGDHQARMDVLLQISNIANHDTLFRHLLDGIDLLPHTREQKEVKLFIRIKQAALKARTEPASERQRTLASMIVEEDMHPSSDPFERIYRLFTLCKYLGNDTNGEYLTGYLDRLYDLIDETDMHLDGFYSQFYTEAATLYSITGNHEKAVEADKNLLRVINRLEEKYRKRGRKYRQYESNYYVIYRRLLSNYQVLTKEEANDYYNNILKLCEVNPDVAQNFSENLRARIYHAMANKDYKSAIPMLKARLQQETSVPYKRTYLEMLVESARALGDSVTLLSALDQYDDVLKDVNDMNTASKLRELEIRYEVGELKADNARMELDQREAEIASKRRFMTLTMAGWLIFGLLMVMAMFYWSRYRRISVKGRRYVNKLFEERQNSRVYNSFEEEDGLPGTDLVKYDREEERRINKRKHKIVSALDMAEYVLNDVLYIASVSRENRIRFIRPVSVDVILRQAFADIPENSGLTVKMPEKRHEFMVDKECLEFLLRRMVGNLIKFASDGVVNLTVSEDRKAGKISFSFIVPGLKVGPEKEELVFDNFINADELMQIEESGMFICRLCDLLLNVDLRLDGSYSGEGSRYILSIPESRVFISQDKKEAADNL